MAEVDRVKKLLFWRTRNPYTDRWDAEITYDDDRKERRLDVAPADAAALVKTAIEKGRPERKRVKP